MGVGGGAAGAGTAAARAVAAAGAAAESAVQALGSETESAGLAVGGERNEGDDEEDKGHSLWLTRSNMSFKYFQFQQSWCSTPSCQLLLQGTTEPIPRIFRLNLGTHYRTMHAQQWWLFSTGAEVSIRIGLHADYSNKPNKIVHHLQ